MSVTFLKAIESAGVEKALYKKIIAEITGFSTAITCAEDPDVEFDISTKGSSYTPQFNFKINDKTFFRLSRGATLADTTKQIVFFTNLSEGNDFSQTIDFAASVAAYDSETNRSVTISSAINDGFYFINILNRSGQNTGNGVCTAFAESANSKAYKFVVFFNTTKTRANIFAISSRTFYDVDDGSNNGIFVSRFPYQVDSGKIDYIKSSVYCDTTTGTDNRNKLFEITSIYDCTSVNTGETISLDDGIYLAVGPHQLVKID